MHELLGRGRRVHPIEHPPRVLASGIGHRRNQRAQLADTAIAIAGVARQLAQCEPRRLRVGVEHHGLLERCDREVRTPACDLGAAEQQLGVVPQRAWRVFTDGALEFSDRVGVAAETAQDVPEPNARFREAAILRQRLS